MQRWTCRDISLKEIGPMEEHIQCKQATKGMSNKKTLVGLCSIFRFNRWNELSLHECKEVLCATTRYLLLQPFLTFLLERAIHDRCEISCAKRHDLLERFLQRFIDKIA